MINPIRSLKNIIKFCSLIANSNPTQITISDINSNVQYPNVLNFTPYGLQVNIPVNSANIVGLVYNVNGDPNCKVAMFTDVNDKDGVSNSLNALANNEVSIGVPTLKSRVHFLANGNIEIILNGNSPEQTTVDWLVKWTELNTQLQALITALQIPLVVTGTATGGVVTGTATWAAEPTINISTAKLNGIEVPNI